MKAELEVTNRLIDRIRRERNLILDRIYAEEVVSLDVGSSDEEVAGIDKLVNWGELEASLIRRGLKSHATGHVSGTAAAGAKRKASQSHPSPSPKKVASEKATTIHIPAQTLAAQQQFSADVNSSQGTAGSKPKRIIKTAEAAAAVPRKVHSVPLDEQGKPILPVTCGIVTVLDLGTVETTRATFHNKRYIWPIGYRSSRQYLSCTDKDSQTTYISAVLDSPAGPLFEVYAEDNPAEKYQSSTSTGVWSTIVKLANSIRGKEYTNSASGPDFYGFSNATIAMMIEMLPGVDLCKNYQKKNFEVVPFVPVKGRSASISLSNPNSIEAGGDDQMMMDVDHEEHENIDVMDASPPLESSLAPIEAEGLLALASQASLSNNDF
jgi:hypothetical protein